MLDSYSETSLRFARMFLSSEVLCRRLVPPPDGGDQPIRVPERIVEFTHLCLALRPSCHTVLVASPSRCLRKEHGDLAAQAAPDRALVR